MTSSLRQDLAGAFRQLRRAPGASAIAILSLALGIGANVVVFSWFQTLIRHPLPGVADSDHLVVLTTLFQPQGSESHSVSLPDMLDLAQETDTFAGIATHSQWMLRLEDPKHEEWVWAQPVGGRFFSLLGVKPALGRLLDGPLDDSRAEPEVVLSHRFWERAFGGDPGVIGRSFRLNRIPVTVVGVAAPGFEGAVGGLAFDLWLPARLCSRLDLDGPMDRDSRWLYAIGRLQPGVSVGAAETVTETVSRRLAAAYPDTNGRASLLLRPLSRSPYGAQGLFMPIARILITITVLVLALILVNLTSLLLAQATTRGKELAIRQALGANRLRIVRQLLTESVLLALVGGAVGAAVATWGVELLRLLPVHTHLPVSLHLQLEWGSLLFAALLAVGCGLLLGISTALRLSGASCEAALRAESRSVGATRDRHLLRSALIVAETALATLVLVGAGLCLKSFHEAQQVERGFEADHVLVAPLVFTAREHDAAERRAFYERLVAEVRGLPSVDSVSLADWVPLGPKGVPGVGIRVDGYQPEPSESMALSFTVTSPGYLETLRIPLLEGRDLAPSDDRESAGVVVVNEATVRRFWPGQSAVGRRLAAWGREFRVVGVIRDIKTARLSEAPVPLLMFSYRQVDHGTVTQILHVRSREDPQQVMATVEKRVAALDPSVKLFDAMPMTLYTDLAIAPQRITAGLLFVMGGVALLLASLGIFGVLAYVVTQRTNELGVRVALGATPGRILQLVLGQGLRWVGIGIVAGLVLATFLSRILSGFLIGVDPTDPAVFASVAVLFTLVGALACYLPARRAVRLDPLAALRESA